MSKPLGHMTQRDTSALRADLDVAIGRMLTANTGCFIGYPIEAINGELAMALYRKAIAYGLHQTGVEAALLAHIERLEAMLATTGAEIVRGQAAAEVLAEALAPRFVVVQASEMVIGQLHYNAGIRRCLIAEVDAANRGNLPSHWPPGPEKWTETDARIGFEAVVIDTRDPTPTPTPTPTPVACAGHDRLKCPCGDCQVERDRLALMGFR